MSNSISFTVPYNAVALSATAAMLLLLVDDLKLEKGLRDDSWGAKGIQCSEPVRPKVLAEADALADLNGEPRPDTPTAIFGAKTEAIPPLDFDSKGFPWDPRIHSSSKALNADGTWKYLRGVDRDALVPRVEAELKALFSDVDWDAVGSDANAQPEAPIGVVTQEPLATPPAPPAPPAMPSAGITTFAQLIPTITAKGITEDKIKEALVLVGVVSLPLLGTRPDLIPAVAGHLGL